MGNGLDRQWRFRIRRGKLLPACTPLPHPNHHPTTPIGERLAHPDKINANSIPGSLGIDINTAPYLLTLTPPPHFNPLNPPTAFPVVSMQAPPTNNPYCIATTTHPRPFHGHEDFLPGKPHTLSLFPILFSSLTSYPAIPIPIAMPLRSIY